MDILNDTPARYARRLAGYISSPTKIESLTLMEFGRAPPLHSIAEMRFEVEGARRKKEITACYSEDYQLPSLIRPKKPVKPKPVVQKVIPQDSGNPFLCLHQLAGKLTESVLWDFGISKADLLGKSRKAKLVDARGVIAALLRRTGRRSYPEIARAVGRNDHSTAINLVSKIDWFCQRNPVAKESYEHHLALLEEAERILSDERIAA